MYIAKTWIPYCGAAPEPAELMSRWNFDPFLLLGFSGVMVVSWWLTRREANSVRRPYAMLIAYAFSALLFISPLCALASALFSIRVSHHVLLVGVISPFLVFAFERPPAIAPAIAVLSALLHAVVFWAWHFPPVYEAALSTDFNYWFMQTIMTGSAAWVWYAVRASPVPVTIAVLLFTTLQMGLLGALLTFAPEPVFAPHLFTTEAWGLSSLEDQQLGGAIMWIVGSGIYLVAALVICSKLFYRKARVPTC
jgi:putative membrane protein